MNVSRTRDTTAADAIMSGVTRLFADLGQVCLAETPLANGRRADIMALSKSGVFTIIEVKSCMADFASDEKWPDYQPYCDLFYFAVDADFPSDRIPDEAGLIIADQFGGAIMRDAQSTPLAGARRKALTLKFARLAARRLMRTEGLEV
ncbi:MAG: MmcB family DNA repair protein [Pseudomonadota bacterium]